jgi:FMN phosphatase YigB (HAD superfamily)
MKADLVIVDFNRTLYDPDEDKLVEGAQELLSSLRAAGKPLALYSAKVPGREHNLRDLGISDFFNDIVFTAHKAEAELLEIITRNGASPATTYVIGDHPHKEIRLANRVGASTIRFRGGKFAALQPELPDDIPNHDISSLKEALLFILDQKDSVAK